MAEKEQKKEFRKASKAPVKLEAKSSNRGSATYGAKDITVLEGLEPVRLRPGMYIGSTGDDGIASLDLGNRRQRYRRSDGRICENITVELLPDNKVSVQTTAVAFP